MQDHRHYGPSPSSRSTSGPSSSSSSSNNRNESSQHYQSSSAGGASLMSPASSSSSSSSPRPSYSHPDDGIRRPSTASSSRADPRYRREASNGQTQQMSPNSNYAATQQPSTISRARSPRPPQQPPARTRSSDRRPSDNTHPDARNGLSPQSPNSAFPPSSSTSHTRASPSPLPNGTSLWATKDLDEDLKRVNLDKCNSAEAIRETIFTRLEIRDSDAHRYELRLTTIDGDAGRPTSVDELWDIWSSGRGKGRAVYVKEVMPGRSGADEEDDLPVGMSAERLNQASRNRAREERQYYNTTQSRDGNRQPSPVSARQMHSPPLESATMTSPRLPQNEYEQPAQTLRSDRPSWTWGPNQRSNHSRSTSGGAGTGGAGDLSPPPETYRHSRVGSLTPTADEFGRAAQPNPGASPTPSTDWGHSPPIASTSRFDTYAGSSSNNPRPSIPTVLSPAGGNAPPSSSSPSWSRSTPAPSLQSPAPPNVVRNHQFHPPQSVTSSRLPPSDPRSTLPQYQPYTQSNRATGSTPVFHNLALQQSTLPHAQASSIHPSVMASLSPGQRTMMSKSVGDLRGQYSSNMDPNGQFRPPTAGVGHPGAYGSVRNPGPPPLPPPPPSSASSYSRREGNTSTPSLHHIASYSPVPFNPRVMAQPNPPPPASSFYRLGLGSYTNQIGPPPAPPLPPRTPYSASSHPPPSQNWPSRSEQQQAREQRRRSSDQMIPPFVTSPATNGSPACDITRHLDLKPGETLQQAGERQRRTSDAPPPKAAHMAAHDPSLLDKSSTSRQHPYDQFGSGTDRYGLDSVPKRDSAGSSVSSGKLGSGSKSASVQSSSGHVQHGRDSSSSSFASSASSSSASAPTRWKRPSTTSPMGTPALEDTSGAALDDRPSNASPPPSSASARSSTSASLTGPLTPAQENVNLPHSNSGKGSSMIPTVVVGNNSTAPLLDSFGDPIDEETSTWFPVNQPSLAKPTTVNQSSPAKPKSTTTTSSSTSSIASEMRRQLSANSIDALKDKGSEDGHTMRGDDWAREARKALMERMNLDGDSESTFMNRVSSIGDSSKTASGGDLKTPRKDEFGDDIDEEGGTFMPGFGPARNYDLVNSTTPQPLQVSFSLKDEPASRIATPTTPISGTPTQKRPNLRLEMPSTTAGGPSSKLMIQSASGSSSNASPPSSSGPRRSAGGDGGDVAAVLSSRRAERAEKLRASAKSAAEKASGLMASSPGISRRNSFRARAEDENSSWAIRPAVETVLENLDVFFPDVDLDKPAFEMPAPAPGTPSPGKETAPSPPSASTATTPGGSASSSTYAGSASTAATSTPPTPVTPAVRRVLAGGGLSHKKSIRVVAQDRKRAMQKAGRNVVTVVHGIGSNLLRRKSTKLFGARIEEVTGADLGRLSNTIREFPDEDPDNFSYKWIKGDLIGRGSFGHVYIGFSVTTGETIAVKQVELPKTQSDASNERTKSMVASLRGEIELLKDLDHPNIVLYLGMEQTPTHLSIFLEYVPGGSIGRIVRTHGKFEEDVIKFFTMQILEGLSYLHGLGILHRDMKADNILTDHDGMCKISDFGTSKKSTDIYNNDENMSMMQGSLFWMAPEVIYNMKTGYSAKADIWSFGCILIEMFAGRRPWSDEEQLQAMFKLATERRRPPVPSDVALSDMADQFINNCLAIDANERPKAFELLKHPFLTLPDTWSFTQTSLYGVMANEEKRRQSTSSTTSSAS